MKWKWIILGALSVLTVACDNEQSERWDEPLDISNALHVGDKVAYINRTTEKLFVLDPVRKGEDVRLDIQQVPSGPMPGAHTVSADGSKIFIVNESTESLRIVDAADPSNVKTVPLQAAYDRIAVDPEGEFVVLSFSGSGDDKIVARNLNEVGVIDLRSDTPSAVFVTLSSRANKFIFAPKFTLDGEEQRMLAVLADNEVTVFDLLADNDDDRLREVPLTTSEADRVRVPTQALFDTTHEHKVDLYVLARGMEDISRITFQLAASGDTRKLNLSTDKLTVNNPGEIALLSLPNGTRLLSIDANRPEFTLVDVVSDVGVTFPLPMSAPAQHLMTYSTVIQDGDTEREEIRVLAWTTASMLMTVIRPETIAVDGDEPVLGRSVEALRLDKHPARIVLATDRSDQAIVYHQGVSAGFSLLNLARNRDVFIQGGSLRDVLFDGIFAYVVFNDLPNLTIFAEDGHPTNFDLPTRGDKVFVDEEDALLLVAHPAKSGTFTVLDANEPTPDNAHVYNGVFLNDLLNLELPE